MKYDRNTRSEVNVAMVCSLALLIACARPPALKVDLLYEIPENVENYIRVLRNKRFAWSIANPSGKTLYIDGVKGPTVKDIVGLSMRFDPKYEHLYFIAKMDNGYQMYRDMAPMANGKVFSSISEKYSISPDSSKVAYVVEIGADRRVYVNDKEDSTFAPRSSIEPEFSPDSKHLAYVCYKPSEPIYVDGRLKDQSEESGEFLVVDGKRRSGFYSWVLPLDGGPRHRLKWIDHLQVYADIDQIGNRISFFGDDGHSINYIGIRGEKSTIVCNGHEYLIEGVARQASSYGAVDRLAYVIEKNSKRKVVYKDSASNEYSYVWLMHFTVDGRLVYVARTGDENTVVVCNGKEYPLETTRLSWCISPDGTKIAFVVKENGKERLLCDGKLSEPADQVKYIRWGANSKNLAYVAIDKGKNTLVVDGKRYPKAGTVFPGPFDKYGRIPACTVGKGKTWSIVNREKQGPFYDEVHGLALNPSNSDVAYGAVRYGIKSIVAYDTEVGTYTDAWGPEFSSDGKRLSYRIEKNGLEHVVCDGKTGPGFETIEVFAFGYTNFTGSKLDYYGWRGRKVYWVHE